MPKTTGNGREKVTKRKPNGYIAKSTLTESAEMVQDALAEIIKAHDKSSDIEVVKSLGRAAYLIQNSIRNLESLGAQTRPPEM